MAAAPLLLLALSGLVDLALLCGGVAAARRVHADAPLGLAATAVILLVFAPLYALKGGLLVVIGGSFFYGLSVLYVTVFVALPAVGLVLFAGRARARLTSAVRALAAATLALPAVGAYATFVEPARLVVERVEVPVPAARLAAPLRVAVLADVQSTRVEPHLERAVAEAVAFEPHLILLPGDLIQAAPEAYEAAIPAFRELLLPLTAPLGAYFVLGNTDDPKRVRRVLEGTQVRLLENESARLEHAGRPLTVGGSGAYPDDARVRRYVGALEREPGDDLRLLCAHYPDVALQLAPRTRVDLVVAGHTHGGQVQLPLVGPPIKLSRVPRRVAAGGLHDLGGRRVYVSRGLGCERGLAPRIRFLAPPEVTLLTLVPAADR